MVDRNGNPIKYLKTDKPYKLNFYIIPKLSICRRLFDAYLGQKCEWENIDSWSDKQFGD